MKNIPVSRRSEFETFLRSVEVDADAITPAHKIAWLGQLIVHNPMSYSSVRKYRDALAEYGPKDPIEMMRHDRLIRAFIGEQKRLKRFTRRQSKAQAMPVNLFERLIAKIDARLPTAHYPLLLERLRIALHIGWHTGLIGVAARKLTTRHFQRVKPGYIVTPTAKVRSHVVRHPLVTSSALGAKAVEDIERWLHSAPDGGRVIPVIRKSGIVYWDESPSECSLTVALRSLLVDSGENELQKTFASIRLSFLNRVFERYGPIGLHYFSGNHSMKGLQRSLLQQPAWQKSRGLLESPINYVSPFASEA